MPDIEAVAERVAGFPLPEPGPIDHWLLLEWRDDQTHPKGGFWFSGMLWCSEYVARSYSIRDPRRERIVHIVEPRG